MSVVISVFNRERLLAQAIESLLPQLQDGDEIVVADDASTDHSVAVAQRYPRTVVDTIETNSGAAVAMNRGVQRARGEWLAFLDSDDLAAPDRFARHGSILLAPDAPDIVFGTQWRFNGEERPEPPSTFLRSEIESGPTIPAMLLRRETYLKVGLLDPSIRVGYFTLWYARAQDLKLNIRHDPHVALWRRAHAGEHLSQSKPHLGDQARALKLILDRRRAAQAATAASHGPTRGA